MMANTENDEDFTEEDDTSVGGSTLINPQAVPYVNDLSSSTVQQIFVRSCLPYTPLDPIGPNSSAAPKYHNCEDCGDKFLFASSLVFHENRYSVAIKFTCEHCCRPLEFYNRCNFLAHLRLHNAGLSEEELAMLDITSKPILNNEIPDNFNISDFLNQAMIGETEPSSSTTCNECNLVVTTTMKEHYSRHGRPCNSSPTCNTCHLVLPTECSLLAHIRTHTHQRPFICPDCATEYSTWDLLSKHMTTVCFHPFKMVWFKCHRCICMFTEANKLYSHILSSHMKCLVIKCHECPYFLRMHCKDNNDSVLQCISHTIICQVCCEEICTTDIKTHVNVHVGDPSIKKYSYKCPSCNFTCEQSHIFGAHMNTDHSHVGTTPALPKLPSQTPRNIHIKVVTTPLQASRENNGLVPVTNSIIFKPFLINSLKKTRQDPPTVLNVDTMPLTPSPEPLVEEDPLMLDSPTPPINPVNNVDTNSKTINNPAKGTSLLKSNNTDSVVAADLRMKQPAKDSKVLTVVNSPDGKNKYLKKKHQCTLCQEVIIFDGSLDPLKRHFSDKHHGYEVVVTKERVPVNSTVNGRKVLLVTHKCKIVKKIIAVQNGKPKQISIKGRSMKIPQNLSNGLVITGSKTATNNKNKKTINNYENGDSAFLTGERTHANATKATYKDCTLTKISSSSSSNKTLTSKHQQKKNNSQKLVSDKKLSVEKNHGPKITEHSPPKRKEIRLRKKKLLDPDFVSNDSDSDYKMPEEPASDTITPTKSKASYTGTKTPPRPKIERSRKRNSNDDPYDETPNRSKKQKRKSIGSGSFKTGSPEALGSGLVISPSKRETDSSFVCATPMCEFSSKDQDAFKEHVTTHRVDKNTFQCMECGLCFVVKPTFVKHLFIIHQISDAELYILNNNCCDEGLICREVDFTDYQKIREENIPIALLEFQCTICYKPCDDSLSLNSHFRTHGMAFLRSRYLNKSS